MKKSLTHIVYRGATRLETGLGFKYNCFTKDDNDLTLHKHDYFEILFLPKDGCTHLANGSIYNLPRGSLIFIRPDDCHDFWNPELKEIEIIHIGLECSIVEKLFDYLSDAFPSRQLLSAPLPPYVILNSFEAAEFLELLSQFNSIDIENKALKASTMRSTIAWIFVKYFSENRAVIAEKTIPEWLSKVCSEMKKIENFSLGIDRMVELSGYSKEHLCRSFKKHLGYTAMSYINDLRLTYIANTLVYTEEEIIDICYDSGYTNLSWMYSLFKKKYGMSPSKFRKINK